MKLGTQGFFEVTDYESELEVKNSKEDPKVGSNNQYRRLKYKKWLDLNETLYLRGFEVADNDLWLRIRQLKKISLKSVEQ